jgi:prophage regulatory protein
VDLVGAQEIADLLGVSRQRTYQLAALPDFPKPVAELAQGRVWLKIDVLTWAKSRGRLQDDCE